MYRSDPGSNRLPMYSDKMTRFHNSGAMRGPIFLPFNYNRVHLSNDIGVLLEGIVQMLSPRKCKIDSV